MKQPGSMSFDLPRSAGGLNRASLVAERAGKRLADIVLGAILLCLALPAMAAVACAIWVSMRGPVFFRQRRTGKGGKIFTLVKFRTMNEARGADGLLLPDAVRLTRLGRILRTTSLDELPEAFNILLGSMSFVGPRPLLPEYLPLYTTRESLRHEVPPGLTGWAQIHGRNTLRFSERLELDAWYVEHWSLWLDLLILLKTVPAVLSRRGAVAGQDWSTVDDRGFTAVLRARRKAELAGRAPNEEPGTQGGTAQEGDVDG